MPHPEYSKSINVTGDKNGTRPIFSDEVFRNLKHATRFAIDIGGSLAKVVYISKVKRREQHYSGSDDETGGSSAEFSLGYRLHFIKAETKYIEQCLEFLKTELVTCNSATVMSEKVVKATGGGAHKYRDLITSQLGCKLEAEGEMDCIVKGCDFLLKNIRNEVFEFRKNNTSKPFSFHNYENVEYPYLVVNIGSGVSILKVESDTKYKRIGGTAMGGGTFWGIGSMLTNAKGFDDLLKLATTGHSSNVDLLVKDIYGANVDEKLNLPADLTASCFGKTVRGSRDEVLDKSKYNDADMAKSLLHMISNDIGQIACLYARVHGVRKIYFGGFFIRNNKTTMHTISFAVDFFSEGAVSALFLRHEGYLGAMGAFLKGVEEENFDQYSWDENYMFSTSFSVDDESKKIANVINMFELDSSNSLLEPLPLLEDPENYVADTHDLALDDELREFWLNIFYKEAERTQMLALEFDPNSKDKAELYKSLYLSSLDKIREQPLVRGSCSVRIFLNLNQKALRDAGYHDIFLDKKQRENDQAKRKLRQRLDHLNSLEEGQKILALITGVLTGNFFDWGSKLVSEYIREGFGFDDASELIQPRPWLVDDFDRLQSHLLENITHYNCALIFVDNSGFDLILGILPLALHLICKNVRVILASNTYPALNDVTYEELKVEIGLLAVHHPEVSRALNTEMLILAQTGSYSPCLDLSMIDYRLAELVNKYHTDILFLTGMGRAIHTNLNASFSCDTVKLAVIKNQSLAKQMGGNHKLCVVCKFQKC